MKKPYLALAALALTSVVAVTLWAMECRRSAVLAGEFAALNAQTRAQAEELNSLRDLKIQAQQIAALKLDADELQALRKEHSELLRLRSEAARARENSTFAPSTATPKVSPLPGASATVEERDAAFLKYVGTPGNTVSWSPGQAAGAPDTHQAGDISTAWAAQERDGGHEWLKLEYERPVEVAQVRIRETYNPGAVSAITAMLANGTEVTLWEGQETKAEAPVEVEFNVPPGVTSNSIRVHLDTSRVPGWNEIDAVELIGRDGTRQWAQSASASSYYGQNNSRNYEALTPATESLTR